MKPQLVVIETLTDLQALHEYLQDKEYIAFDQETTGVTNKHEVIGFSVCAEEAKAYYVPLARWDTDQLVYWDYTKSAALLIQSLAGKKLIMHNATFDCMMAEAFFKVSLIDSVHTDTMLLAHTLNENRRVGLKELASSMFGEDAKAEANEMKASVIRNGGSVTKANYEMYKADWRILAKYGAKDAWLTFKLFIELVPDLYDQGLETFFYDEEIMPLLRGPTYELNTTGLVVDLKRLASLKKQLEAECLAAKDFIHQEIAPHVKEKYPGTNKKNHFNIGAPQQLAWLLYGQLSLEPDTLTKSGKTVCKALCGRLPYTRGAKADFIRTCTARLGEIYVPEARSNGKVVKAKKIKEPWGYLAADKAAMQKLAPKYKWIERLLEYNKKRKLLSTYVEGIEARVQYGVIQPGFLQHGTTSGRYSSRNPNFQNLPRDDKRIKECIIPRPGNVFVGADYSQLEPRVFAYFSNDTRLKSSFSEGADFYSVLGMEVYDKQDCVPLKEGHPKAFGALHPKLRQDAKVFGLAVTYGATAAKLAPLMGKKADDAQEDINSYFEKFPSVRQMMLNSHNQAKTHGFVNNLFGRKRRIPEAKQLDRLYGNVPHDALPYDARKLLNLSVNHQIQSTGASIVNRAAIRLHETCKAAGISCKLVIQVHDSLVIECKEADAEDVALLMQDAMENTVILEGVKLEAQPKIGKNLAEV